MEKNRVHICAQQTEIMQKHLFAVLNFFMLHSVISSVDIILSKISCQKFMTNYDSFLKKMGTE